MLAKDVLTQRVITADPEDSILRAIRLMLQNRISGLPVVDPAGQLVGIVTEGDFLRRAETATVQRRPRWLEFLRGSGTLATEYVHANARKVREVMTTHVYSVADDASLETVVQMMEKHGIKRVPVLRNGKLVGIIGRSNILRAVAKAGREAATAPALQDDSEIRSTLLGYLEHQPWASTGTITVVVERGTVIFSGVIYDDRERDALRVAAENIPGVKGVVDEMVWIDPGSGYEVEPPRQAR